MLRKCSKKIYITFFKCSEILKSLFKATLESLIKYYFPKSHNHCQKVPKEKYENAMFRKCSKKIYITFFKCSEILKSLFKANLESLMKYKTVPKEKYEKAMFQKCSEKNVPKRSTLVRSVGPVRRAGPVFLRSQRSREDIPYHFKKGMVCHF
jgi:hypothetical protein